MGAGHEAGSLDSPLILERLDWRRWRVNKTFQCAGVSIPAGYVTDLASVPRIFQGMLPASGSYTLAAVVHDCGCTAWDTLHRRVGRQMANLCFPRKTTDRLFLNVMADEGVPFLTRWTLWAAVRANSIKRARQAHLEDLKLLPILAGPGLLVLAAGLLTFPFLVLFWAGNRVAGCFDRSSN